MASHQRTASQLPGGTHALSLKVLRLSRPSLATQTPLPPTQLGDGLDIPPKASLAYPYTSPDEDPSSFPLTPLLTLPAAFGAAYVGETFVCTLCVNNEVQDGDGRSISNVKVSAELQTPNNQAGQTLELERAHGNEEAEFAAGGTLQSTLRHDLKEEGAHVLAVTVTYTETSVQEGSADKGRVRSFRKLYQFVSQQLIAVRSKVTERKRREKQGSFRHWILEAQLENVGEASAVLEKVWLQERDGVVSQAVNGGSERGKDAVVLKPQDVEQVMFVLEEKEQEKEVDVVTGQRVPLAQLSIDWRSAMGEKGSLTTGWLGGRAT